MLLAEQDWFLNPRWFVLVKWAPNVTTTTGRESQQNLTSHWQVWTYQPLELWAKLTFYCNNLSSIWNFVMATQDDDHDIFSCHNAYLYEAGFWTVTVSRENTSKNDFQQEIMVVASRPNFRNSDVSTGTNLSGSN